ncbi:MAG: DUF349 domain-containing protein [Bacteroidales bacterium]|nr:DUF349 domain-containing protein [Bacteroidales bacterium]
MSESSEKLEKDVTLHTDAAATAADAVENEVNDCQQTPAAEVETSEPADAEKRHEARGGKYASLTKEELVKALEELVEKPFDEVKDEVPQIKAAFFAVRKEEQAREKAEFLAAGNDEAAFAAKDDACEARIKELLQQLKEKKAAYNAQLEAIKKQNLDKKRKIIDEINNISADADNINKQFSHVQELQQEFKAIGEVPAPNVTDIWKEYQMAVERFYDLLKMNKELRDYDFKKNLEIKQQLCAEAEALDDESSIVDAFKKLQELHNTWRETGPVAKELREGLWARFKAASAAVNKKYQAFFEERKQSEKANADAKTALCEKIEAIDTAALKTYAAWTDATDSIIALQNEWKKLGFASKKVNNALFARFRKSCDEFFALKAEFFKKTREELAANLAKKTELCEKAEALMDSTDWKKATDSLVELQKEWKTIGPVVKKHSNAVWKRFHTACDHFFDANKKKVSGVHAVEHANLKSKNEIVASINALVEQEDADAAEAAKQVRELMAKWQEVGHVPYKEKDKAYEAYRAAVDKAYDKFDMKATRARLANFESSIAKMGSGDKVQRERERLVRTYEQRSSELKTYENNLGFLSARSKAGNTIVKEMERKIAKIKEDLAMLEKKIKVIDEKA